MSRSYACIRTPRLFSTYAAVRAASAAALSRRTCARSRARKRSRYASSSGMPLCGSLRLRPVARRQREQHRIRHHLREVLLHVVDDRDLLVGRQHVHLAEDEDQPIARALEHAAAQELALAVLERLAGVEQEHDGIGARHVAVGDLGALLVEIVDARGIDEDDVVLEQLARIAELDVRDLAGAAAGDGDPLLELARIEVLALAGGQHDARGRVRRPHDVVDRRGRRRDAGRQDVGAEHRVHERRLAVVELAEHDEVEPLGLELGDPRGADVARERDHADAFGDLGELLEPRDDLALRCL